MDPLQLLHPMQVSEKSTQMEAASAKLTGTLAQMQALVASTSHLTAQLLASQQQLKAQQATSQRLAQQLSCSQAECR